MVGSQYGRDDMMSERSVTKKEKDIMELTKLIQKATDTTNSLFENSDHFRFKIKSQLSNNREGESLP